MAFETNLHINTRIQALFSYFIKKPSFLEEGSFIIFSDLVLVVLFRRQVVVAVLLFHRFLKALCPGW